MARIARPRLDALVHGKRQTGLIEVARELGMGPQALRRALSADRFLDGVEASGNADAGRMRYVPLDAVDAIRRWYSYDAAAAEVAARRVLSGQSVEVTLRQEEEARRRAGPKGIGQTAAFEYRAFAAALIVESLPGWHVLATRRINAAGDGADFRLVRDERVQGGGPASISVAVLGPYGDERFYRSNRLSFLLAQVAGSSLLFGPALLVVPQRAAADRCRKLLVDHHAHLPAFELAFLEWNDDEEAGTQQDVRSELGGIGAWIATLDDVQLSRGRDFVDSDARLSRPAR